MPLSQAWTAADGCAAPITSFSTVGDGLGTASGYDESWTYNAAGERTSQTSLDASAGTFAATSYGYSSSDPAEMVSASTTGAQSSSDSYGYDGDGEQDSRDTAAGEQTLEWSSNGELSGVVNTSTGASEASYVYGPDGSLFSSTEGASTTVYLPDEQLTDDDGTVSGVRYYSLPGGVTAVRSGSGSSYGFEVQSDQHGTNTLFLDDTAQDPTWRQFDPFGNARGTAPASGTFPDDGRGFLNDPGDPVTGLADVGARWYDPVTGCFASVDPVLEA